MFYKHSAQYAKVSEVYESNKDQVNAAIVKAADEFIASGTAINSARGWDMIADDSFLPFFAASDEYNELVCANGNEVDESDLIGSIWAYALAQTGNAAYLPLITEFLSTVVNGI